MTLDFEQLEADRNRPQVKAKSDRDWSVVIDGPCPGWVGVSGAAFQIGAPTFATDLNGEDYIARHAEARRIARVPDLEAYALAAREKLKAADGCANWCEALIEMVEGASCDPDDLDEVLMGAKTFIAAYHAAGEGGE